MWSSNQIFNFAQALATVSVASHFVWGASPGELATGRAAGRRDGRNGVRLRMLCENCRRVRGASYILRKGKFFGEKLLGGTASKNEADLLLPLG